MDETGAWYTTRLRRGILRARTGEELLEGGSHPALGLLGLWQLGTLGMAGSILLKILLDGHGRLAARAHHPLCGAALLSGQKAVRSDPVVEERVCWWCRADLV